MRDHGGNIDWARSHWGGEDWIDLSTGINRVPYAVQGLPPECWTMLPTASQKARLLRAAQTAFRTDAPGLAIAGAQAAIQMIPRLSAPGLARILAPTYNEHAATLTEAGWRVEEHSTFAKLRGADLAVIVNPNNPDGRSFHPTDLAALSRDVGRLVIDESFADPMPELSVLERSDLERILVLRSFGKFWGLAGIRLGFVFGDAVDIATLQQMAGPWPVSGPAIEIGIRALGDTGWRDATVKRLHADAERLDGMAARCGWTALGGTPLFRLYDCGDSKAAQDQLARHRIWSRIFPYSDRWMRLGLPGAEEEWDRLSEAIG